nr:LuxR C-terminal-related transcriptional regulator [Pseudomonas cavernae]
MVVEGARKEISPRQTPRWQGNLEEAMEHRHTADHAGTGCRPPAPRRLFHKEVASKLTIAAETVKVHRRHIYAKLKIKSPPELFSLFLKAQKGVRPLCRADQGLARSLRAGHRAAAAGQEPARARRGKGRAESKAKKHGSSTTARDTIPIGIAPLVELVPDREQ